MGINKKDKIEEIIGYLMDKDKSLKKNLKGEKEESYVYFDGRSNYKIRVNARSRKNDSEISLDFFIEKECRPENWKYECYTIKPDEDYKGRCDILYGELLKWQSSQSASDETQSADEEPKAKKDCETILSDYTTNTDPLFPSSNFDMSCLEGFGEKEMLNGISDLEYKFKNGKLVEDVYGKPINFASWGNWKERTSNLEFSDELLQGLQPNIVFCGLNVSTDVEPGNWNNFHKKGDRGNSNLRDSIIGTRLQGAYFTDLIKFYPETAGGKVKSYFKNNKGELERHAEWFVEEMIQLKEFFWKNNSKLPLIIIVMGKTATKELFNTAEIENKLRKEKFDDVKVYFVRHYSQDHKKELPEKIREIVRKIEQDL